MTYDIPAPPPIIGWRQRKHDTRNNITLTLTNARKRAILRHMEETKPKRHNKRGLTAAILRNCASLNPVPWADLAYAIDVDPRNIYSTVARLRKEGRIPASDRQPGGSTKITLESLGPPPPDFLSKPPSSWDSNDLAAIDSLPVLTADQRRKLLSAIGMRPSQGTSQVSALGKLDDMDQDVGRRVGPPAPLTEDEQVARLSRLMRAVGPRVSERAKEAAFESSNPQEIDPSSPSGAVAASEGPLA
jgi:hypothetical protein